MVSFLFMSTLDLWGLVSLRSLPVTIEISPIPRFMAYWMVGVFGIYLLFLIWDGSNWVRERIRKEDTSD